MNSLQGKAASKNWFSNIGKAIEFEHMYIRKSDKSDSKIFRDRRKNSY